MSNQQQIIWTVLPNGIEAGKRAHLSIFVSPRLWTDDHLPKPRLDQFEDWAGWPKRLAGLKFMLRMNLRPGLKGCLL